MRSASVPTGQAGAKRLKRLARLESELAEVVQQYDEAAALLDDTPKGHPLQSERRKTVRRLFTEKRACERQVSRAKALAGCR